MWVETYCIYKGQNLAVLTVVIYIVISHHHPMGCTP